MISCKKKPKKSQTKSEKKYKYLILKGKEFAKDLRKKPTPHEKQFYLVLKKLGYHFLFQHPVICNKTKLYIVDFFFPEYNKVIELDGSQHYTKEGLKKDKLRTRRLRKEGLIVRRIANRQLAILDITQLASTIKTLLGEKNG